MKKIILLLIVLFLLAGCKVQTLVPSAENATPTPVKKTVPPLSTILDDFARLDSQFNTSWHSEAIPDHMIPATMIEPWADRMLSLENETDNISVLLVDARIDMLKSQLAWYLAKDIGPRGELEMSKLGKEVNITEKINCADAPDITKEIKLYISSFKYWLAFNHAMDELLQKSPEAQEKIGVDEKRPAFYNKVFEDAPEEIAAIIKAMKDQCNIALDVKI